MLKYVVGVSSIAVLLVGTIAVAQREQTPTSASKTSTRSKPCCKYC